MAPALLPAAALAAPAAEAPVCCRRRREVADEVADKVQLLEQLKQSQNKLQQAGMQLHGPLSMPFFHSQSQSSLAPLDPLASVNR